MRKSKIMSAAQAVANIRDHQTIMVGGFGRSGTPFALVRALVESGRTGLTIISNDLGSPREGLGLLLSGGQVSSLTGSFYNWNPEAIKAYNEGAIQVKLMPQGTFSESIRSAGMGIPAYYTLASAGTELGKDKETRIFNQRTYVLEEALRADVALIEARAADPLGNLVYCKTARNFNPLMAAAASYTIAQVQEIVELGALDPEIIVTPHVYVNAIVKEEHA
jgi:3-oxoacid CoA-transferase A subunit